MSCGRDFSSVFRQSLMWPRKALYKLSHISKSHAGFLISKSKGQGYRMPRAETDASPVDEYLCLIPKQNESKLSNNGPTKKEN